MKAISLNPSAPSLDEFLKVVDVDINDLQTCYEYTDCDCITIVQRSFMGFPACIVCDDEGLLKDNPVPCIIFKGEYPETLVGRILVTGLSDDVGNLTAVSDDVVNVCKSWSGRCGYRVGDKVVFTGYAVMLPKSGV